MWMDIQAILPFEQIPQGFRGRRKVWVLQVSLAGIQAFIFSDQSIYGTEDHLAARSAYIFQLTQKLNEEFSGFFANAGYQVLSCSSGKLTAAISRSFNQDAFRKLAEDLQLDIFSVTQGTVQMNYGLCKAKICAKKQGKSDMPMVSQVIAGQISRNKYRATHLLCSAPREQSAYGFSPEDMEFVPSFATPKEDSVAIKLDLDNLGLFFSSLVAFDTHKAASQALNQVLTQCTQSAVYIGGDDIFAIAPIDQCMTVVADMYRKIREGICASPQLASYVPHFSISGGVVRVPFSLGGVPPAYYFSRSEDMLSKAKIEKDCICISGETYPWSRILKTAELYETYRQQLTEAVGEQFMSEYYMNPKKIDEKLKQLGLMR